jgi:hypothetical protein
LLANVDKWSWETLLLLQLFEEHLPISLDAYAIHLSGDIDAYEDCLLRLLRMFIQLGKRNYVLCISIFIAELMHWKMHFPGLYALFREKLRYCSEEEVEIFHSLIRAHVAGRKTAEQVAREINALGANMEMLRRWRLPKEKDSSCRAKAVQLTPESIADASRTIKRLFKAAATCESFCTQEGKSEKWMSPVLGEIGDHLLPYALQQSSVRLRGCSGIANEDREESRGFVDPRERRACGHCRTGEKWCAACLASTLKVVREMMMQCTIGGHHIV